MLDLICLTVKLVNQHYELEYIFFDIQSGINLHGYFNENES